MSAAVFVVDPADMFGPEFHCCVSYAARPPAVLPDVAPMRDWTEISIRPVFEVRCPDCGLIGHAARADEARVIRDAHWNGTHAGATRSGAAT